MLKLYKNINGILNYWETWDNNGTSIMHWGVVGEKGETKNVASSGFFSSSKKIIKEEINKKLADGFSEIKEDEMKRLVVEYKVDGHGSENDLEKRVRLESKLKETLGWTGLGDCDGGSMGTGTMEVFCFVVSFQIAKQAIESALKDTEFSDYVRIYSGDGS